MINPVYHRSSVYPKTLNWIEWFKLWICQAVLFLSKICSAHFHNLAERIAIWTLSCCQFVHVDWEAAIFKGPLRLTKAMGKNSGSLVCLREMKEMLKRERKTEKTKFRMKWSEVNYKERDSTMPGNEKGLLRRAKIRNKMRELVFLACVL